MKALFFQVALLVISYSLSGQDLQEVSLNYCINKALESNLELKKSNLSKDIAYQELSHQKIAQLPQINFSGNYFHRVGKSVNPYTNQFESFPITSNSYTLSSSLVVFNGFKNRHLIKYRKNLAQANDLKTMVKREQVISDVLSTYVQILLKDQLILQLKKQIEGFKNKEAVLQELVNSGRILATEKKQLVLERKLQEVVVSKETVERVRLLESLQNLTLVNINEDQELKPLPINIDSTFANSYFNASTLQDLVNSQYSIKSINREITASEMSLKAQKAEFLPKLNLSAGLSTNFSSLAPDSIPALNRPGTFEANTYKNQLQNNLQEYVGVSIQLPIHSYYYQHKVNKINILQQEALKTNLQQSKQEELFKIKTLINNSKLLFKELQIAKQEYALQEEMTGIMEDQWLRGNLIFHDYQKYIHKKQEAKTKIIKLEHELQVLLLQFELIKNHNLPGIN